MISRLLPLVILFGLSACGGGGHGDPDGGPPGRDGSVIGAGCGDLGEGLGQCVGQLDLRVCEDGALVAYTCPPGSACDSDPSGPPGVACFCDDQVDGICPDPVCVDDPDCTPAPDAGPDCTPLTLPAAATNMLPAGGRLPVPGSLAVSGSTLFAAVHYGGESLSAARIIACPTSGCPASPTSFGAPNMSSRDVGLATMGGKVFWTERGMFATFNFDGNVLESASLDGSGIATVYTLDMPYSVSRISGPLATDAGTLWFDAEQGSPSDVKTSGLRKFSGSGEPTAISGTAHDLYGFTRVVAGGGRVAYWVDSVSTPRSDRKLHVLDASGSEIAATAVLTHLQDAAMDAEHLFWNDDLHLWGCTLPACSDAVELTSTYNSRGFALALSGGRLFFAAAVDQGCGLGFTGVLASCDADQALAGTCQPTYHATGFEWINVNELVIGDGAAFATSRTSTSLLRAPL